MGSITATQSFKSVKSVMVAGASSSDCTISTVAPIAAAPRNVGDADLQDLENGDGGLAPFSLHQPERDEANATISFWFPRRRQHRSRRAVLPPHHEHGAIQPGRPINIFCRRHIGIVVNYAAIGYMEGLLPLLVSAIFGSESSQIHRLTAFSHIAILFRIVAALASDFGTIFNSRRRSYLAIGWSFVFLAFAVLTGLGSNSRAQKDGSDDHEVYMNLLFLVPAGLILTSVSSEGLMIEYSHREGVDNRGCIAMLLMATRYVGALLGRSTVSIGDNTDDVMCRGDLGCAMSFTAICGLATLVSLTALLSSVWAIRILDHFPALEPKVSVHLRRVWLFHESPVTWQFMIFGFLQMLSYAWMAPSPRELATSWLRLDMATRWISDGINYALLMITALLILVALRNVNWRKSIIVFVCLGSLVGRATTSTAVLRDITNANWIFLCGHSVSTVCEGVVSLLLVLVMVELSAPRMESTCFVLMSTVLSLGTATGSMLSKAVNTSFGEHTGTASTTILVISLGLLVLRSISTIVTYPLLPSSKQNVFDRQARTEGAKSIVPKVLAAFFGVVFVFTITVEICALNRSTSGPYWTSYLLYTFS